MNICFKLLLKHINELKFYHQIITVIVPTSVVCVHLLIQIEEAEKAGWGNWEHQTK